jgi:hypothetical protein
VTLWPVLFAVYWTSVLMWCLMAAHLCESLSRRHPLLYNALGRPTPLAGNHLRGDVALVRFLLGGRYRFLEDRRIVRLCGAMRALLCLYFLFFLSAPGLMMR